jgi:hypothetical protein
MGTPGRRIAWLALAFWLAAGTAGSQAVEVELELVLAVDTSASVDDAEYRLQMIGIALAFRDRDVVAAIEAHGPRGVAVTMVHWSAGPQQAVRWTHVADGASAARLAAAIETAPRIAIGVTTGIGSALALSRHLIGSNRFEGRRRSIDVSGDGPNNSGLPLWVERTRAVEAGITVNGLAILDGDASLEAYYRDHIIGGAGAFVYAADDFDDFARAFRDKLLREITALVARNDDRPAFSFAGRGRPAW